MLKKAVAIIFGLVELFFDQFKVIYIVSKIWKRASSQVNLIGKNIYTSRKQIRYKIYIKDSTYFQNISSVNTYLAFSPKQQQNEIMKPGELPLVKPSATFHRPFGVHT